jgi:hypothetical protein
MKDTFNCIDREGGVASLIEYLIISGVLMVLMVIMVLSINPIFIDGPLHQLTYNSYTDIGNGVSTRIVDLYVIAPYEGDIHTDFDIPDDVAGRGYFVKIVSGTQGNDMLIVSGNNIESKMSLAGIGATLGVEGNTSSSGLNDIYYNSGGV